MDTPIKLKKIFDLLRQQGFNITPVFDSQGHPLLLDPKIAGIIGDTIFTYLNHLPDDDFSPASSVPSGPQDDPQKLQFPVKRIQNLPDVAGQPPILWNKIGQLPGFQQSGIRKMGRDIFLSFPCFQNFAGLCATQRQDPLSEVFVVSSLTHHQSAVNQLAGMIAEMGQPVQSGVMDHESFIPGYAPRIAIFMTEDFTFKLVQDRPEYGAPISLNSFYAWPGGLQIYRKMALDVAEPRPVATSLILAG